MRQCQGINKRGEPCKRPASLDGDYCNAHNPSISVEHRFGSVEQATNAGKLGGRPRRPKEIELIQEVADEFKEQLRSVFVDGLVADRAVVVGNGPKARLEIVPDHPHRLSTAREILDRLHGKPTSSPESQQAAVSVNLNLIADHDLREQAADLRRRLAADRAIESRGIAAGD